MTEGNSERTPSTPLPRPCDVHTLFLFDFLAVTILSTAILGGLYLLEARFGNLFVSPQPKPLETFVGNGILLTIQIHFRDMLTLLHLVY